MIGVDEVGRGAIAGPLVVCAVRLNKNIVGLKDSKQLTKAQREILASKIRKVSDIGIGWVSNKYIDKYGLTVAHKAAAKKALKQLSIDKNEKIILDGNFNYLPKNFNVETVIQADVTVPSVSAASIIAKVERDRYMSSLKHLENYGFCTNVGYCTRQHLNAIKNNGYSSMHRISFKLKEDAWSNRY